MTRRNRWILTAGLALCGAWASAAGAQAPAPAKVSFYRNVFPILQKRCSGCHQPASRGGKLSVVTYAHLRSGGVSGPGFVPGSPADSPLYKTISGKTPSMPKGGPPLAAREVETVRLWIVQGARDDTPEPHDPIDPEHPPVYSARPVVTALAYSPDASLLAVSGYREVVLHRGDGSGLVARLVGRSQRIESLAFSPDGKYLAAVGGNAGRFGELQIWEVASRRQVGSAEIGFDVLYSVSFSPDGRMVSFGSAEKSVYVYSVPDAKQVLKFDNHSDWSLGTAFSLDSKHFISTGRDRAVKLVEVSTNSFVDDINYQVYNGGYFAIARHPLRDEVAVAGEEGVVRYYSVFKKAARTMNREDYNLLRVYDRFPQPVYALAFSSDGKLLAAGGRAGEVWVYRCETLGERVKRRREALKASEADAARAAALSEEQIRQIEEGKLDEGPIPLPNRDLLQAWLADGAPVAKLSGFTGSVHALAWQPGSTRLAVAGFDGSVRLYEGESGRLVHSFVPVPIGRPLRAAAGARKASSPARAHGSG